jgi:hypothetical protein
LEQFHFSIRWILEREAPTITHSCRSCELRHFFFSKSEGIYSLNRLYQTLRRFVHFSLH